MGLSGAVGRAVGAAGRLSDDAARLAGRYGDDLARAGGAAVGRAGSLADRAGDLTRNFVDDVASGAGKELANEARGAAAQTGTSAAFGRPRVAKVGDPGGCFVEGTEVLVVTPLSVDDMSMMASQSTVNRSGWLATAAAQTAT